MRFGRAGAPESAATVGAIMSAMTTPSNARLWSAIGLFVIGVLFGSPTVAAAAPDVAHAHHHLTADGHHDHLAFTEHAHIGLAATPAAPDMLGDLTAPRSRVALVAVGLLFATALVWGLAPRHTVLTGRDPPRRSIVNSAGRDVLSRLCISRR